MFEQVGAEAPPSRLRAIGQALPRVGLALFCLFVGYTKFDSDPRGEWYQIFERICVGQWLRYLTGVMQTGGAVLLLWRRTLTVGAVMLACTMAGAAFVDLNRYRTPQRRSSFNVRQGRCFVDRSGRLVSGCSVHLRATRYGGTAFAGLPSRSWRSQRRLVRKKGLEPSWACAH